MQFITDESFVITARPSGTEPKIKYYISVNTELKNTSDFNKKETELNELINVIKTSLIQDDSKVKTTTHNILGIKAQLSPEKRQ